MLGKVIVSLVSVILLVGVVIGVVAVLHHDGSSKSNAPMSTTSKAVNSICAVTDYKDECVNSLGSVGKNESATPQDYLVAAIQATIDEVKKSYKVAESIKVDAAKNPGQDMAVEDCKELLQQAIDDLQASFSMVTDSKLHSLNDFIFELLNWFTAVVSYQQSCLDQLEVPEYRGPMETGMLNATKLTSNAINIVSQLTGLLQLFNIQLDNPSNSPNSHSRRLLEVMELGHDGFPSWLPVADRKLLAALPHRRPTPNAVVAQDGSGQFKTINAAIAAIPTKRQGKWIIYVKAGIYREYVIVPRDCVDVFMYGDGPTRTIVTGSKNFGIGKVPTMNTATFAAVGNRFIVKSMGFQNTAGTKGHQAVAFRSQSDMSAYFNCRFEGYQDTLYYQSNRQFYRNCYISGTIDFIFGRGTALIQNSIIVVRMPELNQQNTVTADGNHEPNAIAGLVLQNCRIVPETQLFPNRFKILSYLGRPWDKYAVTAVIESEIGDFIHPDGWMIWAGTNNHNTATIAEYANRGPGANTSKRVRWNKFKAITDRNQAVRYTASVHLEGGGKQPSKWLAGCRVPVTYGFTY